MTVQLLGVRKLDFTSNQGNTVKGTQVFYTHKEKGVEGLKTDKAFLSEDTPAPAKIIPGQNYIIDFNNNGRALGMMEAPK